MELKSGKGASMTRAKCRTWRLKVAGWYRSRTPPGSNEKPRGDRVEGVVLQRAEDEASRRLCQETMVSSYAGQSILERKSKGDRYLPKPSLVKWRAERISTKLSPQKKP